MVATVEATDYGFRSVIHDTTGPADAQEWLERVRDVVRDRPAFHQLIDMRLQTRIVGPEFNAAIQQAMAYLKAHGLLRSVLVVHSRQVALKIKQAAFGTPLYEWERYLDGAAPDWEEAALDWLVRGIDPDTRTPALSDGDAPLTRTRPAV